jgi:ribose-phosphate pyrophosphokinase
MNDLAKRICAANPQITPGGVSWEHFGDGFPNINFLKERQIRSKRVAFLASFSRSGNIFEQLLAMWTLARCGVQHLKIVLPFYPGFQDRVEEEGQVVTGVLLAKMLSMTPICGQGPAEIVIYDIHSLQLRGNFGDTVIPRLKTGIKYLRKQLAGMENVAICFPDFGARKRFEKMFAGFEQIICEKVRRGDERKITLIEGDPRGRHVVIVDDGIQTGGTTINCREVLVSAGASKVSAYATHGIFPKESWRRFLNAGFETVWITDSCPESAAFVADKPPFCVISLADSIARVLVDTDELIETV